MSIIFPVDPVDGQTFLNDNVLYTFFTEKQYWKSSKILWSTERISSNVTSTIASGQSYSTTIAFSTGYMISSLSANNSAWIRIYTSQSAMISDASRSMTTDPLPTAGVVLEAITEGAQSFNISPAIYGYNTDFPVNSNIYVKINNLTSQTVAFTVNLTLIKMGA